MRARYSKPGGQSTGTRFWETCQMCAMWMWYSIPEVEERWLRTYLSRYEWVGHLSHPCPIFTLNWRSYWTSLKWKGIERQFLKKGIKSALWIASPVFWVLCYHALSIINWLVLPIKAFSDRLCPKKVYSGYPDTTLKLEYLELIILHLQNANYMDLLYIRTSEVNQLVTCCCPLPLALYWGCMAICSWGWP